jgi:glycosyltransferase involved in cell wall biosynthesis
MLSRAMLVGAYQRKAEIMAGRGAIDLTVVVPTRWRDEGRERRLEPAHTSGYRLLQTPIVRPGDFHLHVYPRFGAVLDQVRPDVVHVDEEPYNLATFVAVAQAVRRRAPAVFFTWQNLCRRYPPPFRMFERYVYRRSAGAIAGSAGAANVLRAKGYAGPLWVVPQFGVDERTFVPAERPVGSGPVVIGYAGRLVAAKGVDLLLEAAAGLAQGVRLHLIGTGDRRQELAARSERLGLGERVTWSDWLPSMEMPGYYRSIDVLVLPSRSTPSWTEQFGRVLIEAMSCGVPCVGARSGEIPGVLGDAGLLFPEGDVAALRDCLARLAADAALRDELAAAGRRRVLAMFTMETVALDTAAVYRAVAGAASGPGKPVSHAANGGPV